MSVTNTKLPLNTIIVGNCISEMQKLPSNSIDLIFADPPYWMRVDGVLNRIEGTEFSGCNDDWDNQFIDQMDYKSFTFAWLTECKRVLKKNGSLFVIGGMQCIYTIGGILQDLDYWIINDIIWHKKNPTPNFMGTRLNNSHETIIWATKSKESRYTFNYKTAKELNTDTVLYEDFAKGIRKQLGSVWKIGIAQGSERIKNVDGVKLHSTQKPEELLYRIIAIASKIEDVVLDPFGGTMTTGAVAKKMGRRYIMIESVKEYCQYGDKRLARTVESISDIEQAVYDIKPPKVKPAEMIAEHFFAPGEYFYLKNKEKSAKLLHDFKIEFDGAVYDIHTGAAVALNRKANRLNGFDYWFVERENSLVSISDIRENYRRQKYGVLSA